MDLRYIQFLKYWRRERDSLKRLFIFQYAASLLCFLSLERCLDDDDRFGPFSARRTYNWAVMHHSGIYLHPPPPPFLLPQSHLHPSVIYSLIVCRDRMEQVHVRTQPTAQPKVSTSQATVRDQLISNAASSKPATRVPAPVSA